MGIEPQTFRLKRNLGITCVNNLFQLRFFLLNLCIVRTAIGSSLPRNGLLIILRQSLKCLQSRIVVAMDILLRFKLSYSNTLLNYNKELITLETKKIITRYLSDEL